MKILAFSAILILAYRWLVSLFNLITGIPDYAVMEKTDGEISVLIPARNEAANLPRLLQSLTSCDKTIGEIIIYDDQSEDETALVVNHWMQKDPRIRIMKGKNLPAGWTGKNHACHQLAMNAKGKYLLFLDADVTVDQYAIDLALSRMKKDQLVLFSFFPQQEMITIGEWLLVAQVNIILVSLLPLAILNCVPIPVMTAANGQFMMFDSQWYNQYFFHEKVRNNPVEDVAIAQYIKKKKQKLRTALAPEGLKCRMYNNYREALHGLARSARFFFGGSIVFGWAYVLFSLLGWLPVLLAFPLFDLVIYFLLLFTMRTFISQISGQSIIKNLILMPLQQIGLLHLFIIATKQLIVKKTLWRGRRI
jgi:chlorobactene glucosyltransferase